MTYNKETVVGVIEQIIKVQNSRGRSTFLEAILANAKDGQYSKPTLEEVWKEKIEIANKSCLCYFVFAYEGKFYCGERNPNKPGVWRKRVAKKI